MNPIQSSIAAIAAEVRTLLREDDPDLGEMIATAIEGETDALEAMDRLFEREREASAKAAACKAELETLTGDLAKRGQRYAARAARFKDLRGSAFIAWAGATDARKLERPAYSMSYRRTPPGLQVTDPDLIPRRFLGEPRKTDLLRALKGGEEVPGAVLSNGGETVATRTK